jgi:sirohydrochlorin cobaltochelatase
MDACLIEEYQRDKNSATVDGMKTTEIGLLLIGHGASQGGGAPLRRLVERLKTVGAFAQVAACFWKEKPYVGEGLGLIGTPTVLAVPVFATEGRIAKDMIPAEMGLSGPVTRFPDGRCVHYLRPVGVHPGMTSLLKGRALAAAAEGGLDPCRSALMLIAHGNKQGGGARASAEAVAQRLRADGSWASVTVLFLEEEPLAQNWRELVPEESVVVVPLLLAAGQHASRDVAPLFGLAELQSRQSVSLAFAGRRLAISAGLGDDEALAELILRMCREALLAPNRP